MPCCVVVVTQEQRESFMKAINISFTVVLSLHLLLILFVISDIVYVEYIMNGEVGIGGFVKRLTISYAWSSLAVISLTYFVILKWKKISANKLTEANWLVAGFGIMLGAWVALPLIFGLA